VANIEMAMDQVQNIVAEFDGYVDQEQPQAYGSTEANFVVRLPKERFNEATQHIKMVGEKVNNERAIGQDITEQYALLEKQLCELEEEAIAVRQGIARNQAGHLNTQLTDLESEIEFMRGKIVYRDERLALATLTLILVVE
jgi:flagellar biosynthesis chaperone FliJ